MRNRAARALLRLTLAAALLVGAAPARGALDRCMTPFEEEVHLLVNQRRAQGAVCGGTRYAPASALEAEQMLQNSAKRHTEDMALRDFVSHVNPDGASLGDRVAAEDYPVLGAWGEHRRRLPNAGGRGRRLDGLAGPLREYHEPGLHTDRGGICLRARRYERAGLRPLLDPQLRTPGRRDRRPAPHRLPALR